MLGNLDQDDLRDWFWLKTPTGFEVAAQLVDDGRIAGRSEDLAAQTGVFLLLQIDQSRGQSEPLSEVPYKHPRW